MKIIKGVGAVLAIIAVFLGAAYLLRGDPIGPIAGKQLAGTELPRPYSWNICNNYDTVAVETNPDAPYSVTTWCVVVSGVLYIPSSDGASRTWTQNVIANPNIRIKIGERIYPAKATRVTDIAPKVFRDAILDKYPEAAEMAAAGSPESVWIFRVDPRD